MTQHLGYNANLFGGTMLSWLDEAAVAFACQACETPKMVTVKMSEVEFKHPVRAGQIIKIYGDVITIGNSSVELLVEARRHSPYNGTEKLVCKTVMTFVRVDGDGEPVPISDHIKQRHSVPDDAFDPAFSGIFDDNSSADT